MLASKQTVVILNILRRKVISSVYSYIRIFHKIEENNNNLTPNVVPCLEPAGLSANDTTIMIDPQAPGRELRWVHYKYYFLRGAACFFYSYHEFLFVEDVRSYCKV